MDGTAAADAGGVDQRPGEIPFPLIANRLNDGKVVPFLGAGASSSGVPDGPRRLPRGKELAKELIAELNSYQLDSYPGEASDALTKVTQYWVDCPLGRLELYERLRKRFYEDQRGADLNVTVQFLAEVPTIPCIVTTNYDEHIEEAFRRINRDFVVLTHETVPRHVVATVYVTTSAGERSEVPSSEFLLSDYKNTTIIYKMHGTVTPPPEDGLDTIVITEDDYVNFLAVAHTAPLPPHALIALFARCRFLFLGYSLEDWNFRVILRRLTDEGHRGRTMLNKHWAVRRDPSSIERLFWNTRNVWLFDAPLEYFVEKMREALK